MASAVVFVALSAVTTWRAYDVLVGELTTSPAGDVASTVPTADLADGQLTARYGDSDEGFDGVVDTFVADLDQWWVSEYPALSDGQPYVPLEGGVWPMGEDREPQPCGGIELTYEEMAGNAFVCSVTETVVYDSDLLFPVLLEQFGPGALGVVLAHEWAHVIQWRTLDGVDDIPGVVLELQADCVAGAWLAQVERGSPASRLVAGPDVVRAVAAVLEFRDPLGVVADDEGAHGSAFDRLSAVQDGFEGGLGACSDYVTDPPPTFQLPWNDYEDYVNDGNLDADLLLPALSQSLTVFESAGLPDGGSGAEVAVVDALDPVAAGCLLPVGIAVGWCESAQLVAVDLPEAQQLIDKVGDMAVGFLVAEAYFGRDGDEPTCPAGLWVAQVYQDTLDSSGPFVLSPGDLDEVVQLFVEEVLRGTEDWSRAPVQAAIRPAAPGGSGDGQPEGVAALFSELSLLRSALVDGSC